MLGWVFIVSGASFIMNYFHRSGGDVADVSAAHVVPIPIPSLKAASAGLDRVLLGMVGGIYAIQMSIFLARISRGRTVRELCFRHGAGADSVNLDPVDCTR